MKKVTVIGTVIFLALLMVAVSALDYGFSYDGRQVKEPAAEEVNAKLAATAAPEEKEKPLGNRPKEGWLFGFSSVGSDAGYYVELEKTLQSYIHQAGDTLLSMDAENSSHQQAEQLRELMALGVDAIFLSPVAVEEILPVLEELEEKGIPVIMIDQGAEELEHIISVVDSDNFNSGFLLGDYLVGHCEPGRDIYHKAKILAFSEKGEAFGKEKLYGFRSAIGDSLFRVEREIKASHDKEELRSLLKEAMEEIEDLHYIFSICDEMTVSILEICEEEGYEELKVFTVGGSPKIKELMQNGNKNLEAFAAESPISLAMNAYSVMTRYLDGQNIKKQYLTETFLVTRENIADYRIDTWQ